jgi:hypothetical protein
LGESDLAALQAHFNFTLEAWAREWIPSETVPRALSVSSCRRSESDADQLQDRASFPLSAPGIAQVWSTQGSLERWGHVFVLEGDKLTGDTRFENEMSSLARGALTDFVNRSTEPPTPIELAVADPWVDDDSVWGWDGIQVALQVGEHFIECYFSRDSVSRWIKPMEVPTQRLGSVKLPASLSGTPYSLRVTSLPFDVLATDFLTMQVGAILTLDQPLDTAFLATLPSHTGIAWKAYPGRSGQTLAVEIFGN